MLAPPLTPAQATADIRRILRTNGEVRFSQHAENDANVPRDWAHDVAEDEVHHCLQHGSISQPPERDLTHDEWVYRVEFQYDTHQLITVTAIFTAENVIRVITRFRKKTAYNKAKPKAKMPKANKG